MFFTPNQKITCKKFSTVLLYTHTDGFSRANLREGDGVKVTGIVAEYDPFHNGHKYLIDKARENGSSHIIAVMSGNFLQRGAPALLPVEARVKAALSGGADLVIQLPVNYAVSTGENFARGAVEILNAAGVVDEICFGSETGEIGPLLKSADALLNSGTDALIRSELEAGITYAKARENAVKKLCPGAEKCLKQPNDILGVEYIKALKKSGSGIKPVTFKRYGAGHNCGFSSENFASGSEIRRMILEGEDYEKFVPETAFSEYKAVNNLVDFNKYETVALYKMRSVSKEETANIADISEGLENRILSAAGKAASLEELYSLAKTKRYTHARIRRIVLSAVLGITSDDSRMNVPYIRILGMNDRGAELLKLMKKEAKLPVLVKTKDVSSLDESGKRVFSLECTAGDIYSLILKRTEKCSAEIERKIIKF